MGTRRHFEIGLPVRLCLVLLVTVFLPSRAAFASNPSPWPDAWQLISAIILTVAVFAIASVVLIYRWRATIQRLARAQRQAEALFAAGRHEDSLKIVEAARNESLDRRSRDSWRRLEMDIFEKTNDIEGLREMCGRSQRPFGERESAALTLARAEVEEEHFEAFITLRNLWRGREERIEEWLSLDVDALMKQDKDLDAGALLAAHRFTGAKDCGLAARYALLEAGRDLAQARTLMAEAVGLDPQNPEVYVCRARYLEIKGQDQKALNAYRNALQCRPQDPFLKDHLAEALRRYGSQDDALETWRTALDPPSMGFIWLKTLFWTRVSLPKPMAWEGRTLPRGNLRPLIEFMLQLDPDRFWDARAFAPIAERQPDLLSRQETFWLRVLESLRTNADGEALSLLNLQGFGTRSWNPSLEGALLKIVIYRLRGFLGPSTNPGLDDAPTQKSEHPFFLELDEWTQHSGITVPEDGKRFLKSSYVFAAACFAAGWWEAGLRLSRNIDLPGDTPQWFMQDLEEAQRQHAR